MSIEQEPLVKTVIVPTTPDRAFRLFTAELGRWWPLASHSVRGDQATDVRLEGAVGGQIIEYDAAGPVGSWGTVSDWDPPHTVSFSWHPGSDPQEAGQVTVRFIPTDESTGSGGGPDGRGPRAGTDARALVGDERRVFGGSGGGTDGSGSSTLVELTHTGWERRPDGAQARENYDSGWTYVLGHFVQFRP